MAAIADFEIFVNFIFYPFLKMVDDSAYEGIDHTLTDCQQIRKKDLVLLEDSTPFRIVEITEISSSKPGKHGAAKFTFIGINLATEKNVRFNCSSGTKVRLCSLKKMPCFLITLDEHKQEFMGFNEETNETFSTDLSTLPEEGLEKIKNFVTVSPDARVRFVYVDTPYYKSITDVVLDKS